MRDFNSGDIHGDVTIQDNSNNNKYKLLMHCNNDELLREEKHRFVVLSKERARKNKGAWKILVFSGVFFLVAASWFFIQGQMNFVTFLIGAAGVLISMAALEQINKTTSFEQRQIAALNEIDALLRERGVRS